MEPAEIDRMSMNWALGVNLPGRLDGLGEIAGRD
jgi:hypothetical protein